MIFIDKNNYKIIQQIAHKIPYICMNCVMHLNMKPSTYTIQFICDNVLDTACNQMDINASQLDIAKHKNLYDFNERIRSQLQSVRDVNNKISKLTNDLNMRWRASSLSENMFGDESNQKIQESTDNTIITHS